MSLNAAETRRRKEAGTIRGLFKHKTAFLTVLGFTAGGSLTNGFAPTTTLGCGSWGGNSISENLDYKHLMNVSRIGKVIANKKVPTDAEIWA